MNKLEQAKTVSLVGFLSKNGYQGETRGEKVVFSSPLHSESNPSFFVRTSDGKWRDYGLSDQKMYEDPIDFVQRYYGVTLNEAIDILLDGDLRLPVFEKKAKDDRPYYEIKEKRLIEHRYLLRYLKDRKIDADLARKYCEELHIIYPRSKHPKTVFYAIGFENMSGGYDIRNTFQKMTLTPSNISKLPGTSPDLIFEGFFNFLTYMMYFKTEPKETVYVLNGSGNWRFLSEVNGHYFGDNDKRDKQGIKAGDELLKNLRTLGNIIDRRYLYDGYGDFNEYWVDGGGKFKKNKP
jgi:hypothetical protein